MATVISYDQFVSKPETQKGNITRKRGSQNLYVDFYYYGERIVKSTGLADTPGNYKKARNWLNRVMERIANGTFSFAEAFPGASAKEKAFFAKHEGREYQPEPRDILIGSYIEQEIKKGLAKEPSATKRRDQIQIIDYHLLPLLGDKTFYQLNGVLVSNIVKSLVWKKGKNKGQPLSASRKRNILSVLGGIWNSACAEYHWQLKLANPFIYLKQKREYPKRKKNQPVVFRFGEWLKLVENFDPYYRIHAEIFVLTGLSGSEMAGFRRHDIQGDQMHICNSIVRESEKDTLKTVYRRRELPITRAIRERLDVAISRSTGEHIFTMKSGRTFNVDSFRKNPWTSALRRSGIEYRVPYTTRHTFAAWALAIGIDPNKLVSLMGHGSKEMIYEVYGTYVKDLEKDAGKILEYFGKDLMGL